MKAEELRIGNLIEMLEGSLGWRTHVVSAASISHFIKEFQKPIPLTEEWLMKFGFETDNNGVEFDDPEYCYWFQKTLPVIGEICQCSDKTYLFDTETDTLRIKYVHQLQNLYFALTGEELQYESTINQSVGR